MVFGLLGGILFDFTEILFVRPELLSLALLRDALRTDRVIFVLYRGLEPLVALCTEAVEVALVVLFTPLTGVGVLPAVVAEHGLFAESVAEAVDGHPLVKNALAVFTEVALGVVFVVFALTAVAEVHSGLRVVEGRHLDIC